MSQARRGARRRRRRRLPDELHEPSEPSLQPDGARVGELCELGPFAVFCALHLGITERNGYALQPPAAVARRFAVSLEELERYLVEHRLTAEHLSAAGFDLESARFDMQVAPAGVSRVELARTLFDELRGPPARTQRRSSSTA
jgi:hypothetical protein